jgi:membrane protein DedA with SNARE-associated domain
VTALNLAALYVYWVIIAWIFITGVGLIPFVPEEVAVAGLGAWTHHNPDALLLFSWLICIGAVLGTDLFLFMIGRLGGPKLMNRKWVQRVLKPERVQTFARKFQEKGIWFMLTARLIPGWRTAVFITAGVIHFPVQRFILADAISSVPLVTFFFMGGYFAADWINGIIGNLHQAQHLLLFLLFIVLVIVATVIYIRWMRLREEEEAIEEAQEHLKMEQQTDGEPAPVGFDAHASDGAGRASPQEPSANGSLASGAERPIRSQPK